MRIGIKEKKGEKRTGRIYKEEKTNSRNIRRGKYEWKKKEKLNKLPSFKHPKVGLPVFSYIFHWHPYNKRSPKLLKGLCSKALSKLVIEHSEQLSLLKFLWTKAAKCYTKGTTETEEKINKQTPNQNKEKKFAI